MEQEQRLARKKWRKSIKRIRCKNCFTRINVSYDIHDDKISFTCKKCGSHGEFNYREKVRYKKEKILRRR